MSTTGRRGAARFRVGGAIACALIGGVSLAGCTVSLGASQPMSPKNDSGYRVLAGLVSLPVLGTGQSATPFEQFGSGGSKLSPDVPSPSGQWFMTSSSTALFPRTQRVQIMATGAPGERFNLFWEETCGGTRVGTRGVVGGSGGEADLTLRTPALVLVKLPSRYGTYNMCYLATTVSMHTRNWKLAKAAAPTVKIIHY